MVNICLTEWKFGFQEQRAWISEDMCKAAKRMESLGVHAASYKRDGPVPRGA